MKKQILSICLALALCLSLLPGMTLTAVAADGGTYLALGDSITTGYAPDGKVDRPFADQVAAAQGYTLVNLAADGEISASLLTKLTAPGSEELTAATGADLITITIGGNDLMGALYEYLAEEYVKDNPDESDFDTDDAKALLMSGDSEFLTFAVNKISDPGFTIQILPTLNTFTSNLTNIIGAIKQVNPNATILVATQYNPYYYLAKSMEGTPFADTASKISTAFEAGLTFLNGAISTGTSAGYQVIDVHQTFKDAVDGTPPVNPCNPSMFTLDFHPNQTGHDLIAEAINGQLPKQNYSLSVGGTTVTSQNANDVLDDGGTVRYDAATNTLKLNNANIDCANNSAISYNSSSDFTIEIIGENHVSSSVEDYTIYSSDDLVLRGSGSLEISSEKFICIYANSISITSGTYTFDPASGQWDVYAADTIEIAGSDTVITTGTNSVFGGNGDIILNGAKFNRLNRLYSATGDISIAGCEIEYTQAIQTMGTDGKVNITNSTISIPDSTFQIPIYGQKGITISGGKLTVHTVYGNSAIPIYSESGDITIKDGAKLTVIGDCSAGIFAGGEITIDGAGGTVVDVNATGYGQSGTGSTGIHSVAQMFIQNGAVVRVFGTRLGMGNNYAGDLPITIIGSWVETTASNTKKGVGNSVLFHNGVGSVYGTAFAPGDVEIGEDMTLTVPENTTLTVPDGAVLANNGTLTVEGIMEVRSTAKFTGPANVSGKVYVLEADGGVNPVEGAAFTLGESGEVYAQRTALSGTTIQHASRMSGNYSYTPVNGSAETFTNQWSYYISSDTDVPNYSITAEEPDNGSITLSHRTPEAGTTVTLTATADAGYVLDTLTVTGKSGTELTLTPLGDGKYSFKMPAEPVAVKAAFVPVDALPFTDVDKNAWYADAVDFVYQHELMNGTSGTTFSPHGTMTRAMLVTILWRQAGEPVVNYLLPFTDVTQGTWYNEAVRWAASEGIVTGISATSFAPDDPITREQFAAMLYRYARHSGTDVSVGEDTNILSYADALDVSEYAIPAMQWTCGAGVIQGSGANLNPKAGATRAEAAAMFMRFAELDK